MSTEEMKITALAPWFGGKRTLAPRIVAELGPHHSFWDVFCGGISIIFAKDRVRQECCNDLHGDVTNLAMAVSSPRRIELYERSVMTLYSQGVYEACRDELVEAIPSLVEFLKTLAPAPRP